MDSESTFRPLLVLLFYALSVAEDAFFKLPGSAVIARYVKSSHQNDPGRTILELFLVLFAVRTLLQSRTRGGGSGKTFVQFTEEEIDELVDEWNPEPLAVSLDPVEKSDLNSVPVIQGANGARPKLLSTGKRVVNLASYNFAGLAGNEHIKDRAVETLRKYGLGSCGPPGFYGTIDVHMDLERDIAQFLGTEGAILYSQGFSTISSVIPAFCKRGDIIVADRGVNFAIQKGLQISRSTIRWYDHNDLTSLEEVLQNIEKERRKKRQPLTRRFIVTEGIFENDGALLDLPKVVELKEKYKFRLILDESFSFGMVGKTGRGLTELYNVPVSSIDMLIGSIANSLCAAGGFCAGSSVVVEHQRINGTSFVFSAAIPALLAVSASEAIKILMNTPSLLTILQNNVRVVRSVLDKLSCIDITSHPLSSIIHIRVRPYGSTSPSLQASRAVDSKANGSASAQSQELFRSDYKEEERLLQQVAEEVIALGVMITRAKRLHGEELFETPPSIRLAITAALSAKECEEAAGVIKAALVKVLSGKKLIVDLCATEFQSTDTYHQPSN